MFNNRPGGPSNNSNHQFSKPSVMEACDRIKDEFHILNTQIQQTKADYEKLVQEKNEIQRNYVMYYEMSYGLNVEMHKQTEISKRLNAILVQVIPFLSTEHQTQVSAAVERAKQVTPQELNSIIADDSKYSKSFSNGGFSINSEQIELYKQLAALGPQSNALGLGGSSQIGLISSSLNNNSGAGSNPLMSIANINPASSHISNSLSQKQQTPQTSSNPFANMFAGANPQQAMVAIQAAMQAATGNAPSDKTIQQQAAALAALAASQWGSGGVSSNHGPNVSGLPSGLTQGVLSCAGAQLAAAAAAASSAASGGLDLIDLKSRSRSRSPSIYENKRTKLEQHDDDRCDDVVVDDDDNHDNKDNLHHNLDKASTPSKLLQNSTISKALSKHQSAGLQIPPHLSSFITGGMNAEIAAAAAAALTQQIPSSLLNSSNVPGVSVPGGGSSISSNQSSAAAIAAMRTAATGSANSLFPPGYSHNSLAASMGFDPAAVMRAIAMNPAAMMNSIPGISNSASGLVGVVPTATSTPTSKSSSNSTRPSSSSHHVYCHQFNVNPETGERIGQLHPISNFQSDVVCGPDLPRKVRPLHLLPHGEVVCAVTMAQSTQHVLTGGKGVVKVWDLTNIQSLYNGNGSSEITPPSKLSPIISIDCLNREHYIRSLKLFNESKTLVVGGEANRLTIWDLGMSKPMCKGELMCQAQACYALALSPDGRLCYSCGSDGNVSVWDMNSQNLVRSWVAHADGASCVDILPDGNRLWTGGLDNWVRYWDLRSLPSSISGSGSPTSDSRHLFQLEMATQVFSLGHCPVSFSSSSSVWEGWIAMGLENSYVELFNYNSTGISGTSVPWSGLSQPPRSASVGSISQNNARSNTPNSQNGAEISTNSVGGRRSKSPAAVGTPNSGTSSVGGSTLPNTNNVAQPSGGFSVNSCGSQSNTAVPSYNSPVSSNSGIDHTINRISVSALDRYQLNLHSSCVLSLKFAHSGKWFVSTGKDNYMYGWKTTHGANLFQIKENASVLTCDISPDDKFIVTGSGDKKATLYEIVYGVS